MLTSKVPIKTMTTHMGEGLTPPSVVWKLMKYQEVQSKEDRMSDQKTKRSNEPVSFVDASVRTAKTSGSRYVWSRTFDLDKVKREVGTHIVTLKVTIPKNRKNGKEDDRLIIFSPSEAKYLPQSNGGNGKSAGGSKQAYGGAESDVLL